MLQLASQRPFSGVHESVNDIMTAATSAVSPRTNQFAHISEMECEPQQCESSGSQHTVK